MSGNKRHLVTLQTRSNANDSYGDQTITYTDLAEVWAQILTVSGRERWDSKQVEADVSHRVRINFATEYEGMRPEDRIVYGARTFDIVAGPMDSDGMRRDMDFLVMERF